MAYQVHVVIFASWDAAPNLQLNSFVGGVSQIALGPFELSQHAARAAEQVKREIEAGSTANVITSIIDLGSKADTSWIN